MKSFIMFTTSTILLILSQSLFSQVFVHPGIDMTSADLKYMKDQVLTGAQPWKDAFERMKNGLKTDAVVTPFAHVQRGPYGKPNIGGGELSRNSSLAYDCALMWYITGDKKYAEISISILNGWSAVLRDFDYNDAKLLAGWTGYQLCNAAEVLRYTGADWKKEDIDSFTRMLMTVYYPLMRYYYPQANGNWDGAIIHSILAIAIFTDNREMFDNAIDHFLHGPVNGSLFKYIYPSGQCQESTRDQGHVQLGLGEFAGAARVAYTQGVDLFSAGNNRLAAGYEYTSGFLLGNKPQCYGPISDRAKNIRDDYEYVYRHYASKGLELPFTRACADSARKRAARSVLTAFRTPSAMQLIIRPLEITTVGFPAGAMDKPTADPPSTAVMVKPGQSLQEALTSAAGTGKWVIAARGIHTLSATLKIPSGTILSGEGLETILFLDPASGIRDAMVSGEPNLHDVTIRDLVIEGNTRTDTPSDPNSARSYRSTANRGGIMFIANRDEQLKNINLINITVRNCTYNAVFINGAKNLSVICCDLNESGTGVVPGAKLQHNLLITYSSDITVKDCRLVNSPNGSGLLLDHCSNATISNCEISRNGYYGLTVAECSNLTISGNLIEANDRSGIMAEYLFAGSENLTIEENQIQYNNGFGIESYSTRGIKLKSNKMTGNGNSAEQQKISGDKSIIMN
jgi:parallel beta-helix repeat protein